MKTKKRAKEKGLRRFLELVDGSFQELGASSGAPGGVSGGCAALQVTERVKLLKLREALTRALQTCSQ